MRLTENSVSLPEHRELLNTYVNSSNPMIAITKYVMLLRRKLRKDLLESKSENKRKKLYTEYWEELRKVYTIERDMSEIGNTLRGAGIENVDILALYNFLKRTAPLNYMEIAGVHYKAVPWQSPNYQDFSGNNTTCHAYFDSWWPMVFIELKDDPRKVLKDVKFVNITNATKIKEKDWHRDKECGGIAIIRRIGEIPAFMVDNSGMNIQYIYIKGNPSDKTKTVLCFGIPEFSKKLKIRVYPIMLRVSE